MPFSRECLVLGGALGALAFGLTFLAGLFGGVAFGSILLQSLLYTLLVGLLGLGLGLLLERFVPGIWQGGEDGGGEPGGGSGDGQGSAGAPRREFTIDDDGPAADGAAVQMRSFTEEELAGGDAEAEPARKPMPAAHGATRVVGDYRIIDDKKFPDNPDDYAKAIRTMMKKDE